MTRGHNGARPRSKLTASLGPGRIAFLQPWCRAPSAIVEVAVGTQSWWARSIHRLGRDSITAGVRVTYPDRGPLTPADGRVSPVPERATWEFLRRSVGARFGVASRFQLQSDSILEIDAHLFEQRGAGFETLDTWERSCAAPDYAETAFELLCDLARRVGARRATGGWTATFGTGDAEAALTFLRALGGLSLVDWGLPQHGEAALDRLVDALALDPTMAPAIAHLPEHFVLVRDRGGVSPFILARAYRRAVEIVGGVPEAWAGVDNQLRAGSVPAEGS